MADDNGQRSDAELGELAAFADGSLAPAARARVAARVQGSSELGALVQEQRRAIAAIRAVEVRAPAALPARLALRTASARRRSRPRRLVLAGGLAATVAATVALVMVLAGDAAAPTFGEAVEAAQRGPAKPAPATADADPNLLAASVDGVAFPDYSRAFGWRAFGERSDQLDGRQARTVYYRRAGQEVAYTIVSGEALVWPTGARTSRRDGIELRSLSSDEAAVVIWLRDGHTCVLSGAGVPPGELRALAAWMGEGSVVS